MVKVAKEKVKARKEVKMEVKKEPEMRISIQMKCLPKNSPIPDWPQSWHSAKRWRKT